MIRKCLFLTLVAGLIPSAASAEDDDLLSDAVVESEEEKKPKKPLLIPLQPVWKTIEPARIDDAVKNIAPELGDSAGFAVEQYNPLGARGSMTLSRGSRSAGRRRSGSLRTTRASVASRRRSRAQGGSCGRSCRTLNISWRCRVFIAAR